jgi:CPA2 family monovalent cation:H+ antiporter-2
MFRSLSTQSVVVSDLRLHLADVKISTVRVTEDSPIVGRSLAQIDLRKRFGVTLLAIRRDSHILSNPSGEMKINANDVLVILGSPEETARVAGLFQRSEGARGNV